MTFDFAAARGAALALVASGMLLGGCADPGKFEFAILGDMPYTRVQEKEFESVLADMNRRDLQFAVHVGDFEFDARPYNMNPSIAAMPCADETYQSVLAQFQTSRHPFIYTPGDNDWSDCAPLQARKIDIYERLARIRTMFFPPGRSLGQRTIPVLSQGSDPVHKEFLENLRWSHGGITFVTIHTVGSNDNTGGTPAGDAEEKRRKAANIAWLKQAFAAARADDSRGLVIITQANIGFENFWPPDPLRRYFNNFLGVQRPPRPLPMAYDDYIRTMAEELETYTRPVAFFHGDSHIYRVDKPLFSAKTQRLFENFTRYETFGYPDSHWLRVSVDPSDPALFTVRPQMVPENNVSRRPR